MGLICLAVHSIWALASGFVNTVTQLTTDSSVCSTNDNKHTSRPRLFRACAWCCMQPFGPGWDTCLWSHGILTSSLCLHSCSWSLCWTVDNEFLLSSIRPDSVDRPCQQGWQQFKVTEFLWFVCLFVCSLARTGEQDVGNGNRLFVRSSEYGCSECGLLVTTKVCIAITIIV